ncbi:TIGR03984 family CRISPR-associated protein [Nostocaceae cyanobacterium CENA357]|uniref:TIGR03984 family CRISPR-associated protein n=1 Tax=Atlanticothrix silvestris CENA357 TaxID=1725252 RepID=A0A8J7KYE4_9CYAN|nr:CRISPR-associated protein Csx19 [Atlanticothrix silvestris]MBH8551274.1 TIGR03984 family CRISPR-associated protein [Atlanticothrix silvestris CENA357]
MNKPSCEHLEVPRNLDLQKWLGQQAKKNQLNYLLGHAEDGVIWGKFLQDGSLITSDSVFSQFAKLRSCTLQQCRAFGENAEVMLWQSDEGFKARLIKDEHLKREDYIPEDQILLGTQAEKVRDYFTLVSDGSQGLRHAVPLVDIEFDKNSGKTYRPLRLSVRHYIDCEQETGLAHIYLSRLVKLTTEKELAHAAKTYS